MSSKYETVVGLEVHTELKTKSKIFCGCTTEFGGDQNTHVCPVCLGLPGAMPVLNKQVVEFAIKVGLALNCEILNFNKFDRKNYYYPDLPKNYQTSQYDLPICLNGHLDIEVNGETKRIGITRIHMEEDAGKLVHSGNTISDSNSSNEIGPGLNTCSFSFVQSTIVLACNALHVPKTIPSIFGSCSYTSSLVSAVFSPD